MALTLEEIKAIGYKKLDLPVMYDYIEANAADYMEEFAAAAFVNKYPTVATPIYNPDGSPKMKKYKPVVNGVKQSHYVEKQVVEMVADKTQPAKKVYNAISAKKAFCAKFCPELLPVKKAPEEKASDKLRKFLK